MATLAEVAQRAGVSKTTASRVLNGLAERHRITAATVAQVESAARELKYHPSYAARALTRGRTDNIGLLVGSDSLVNPMSQPFMATVLGGINAVVRPAGRHVVLGSERDRYQTLGFAGNPADRFDALIAFNFVFGPQFTTVDVENMDVPLVVIGDPLVPTRRPVVTLDPEPGIHAAIDHLRAQGHQRMAWIALARPPVEQARRPSPDDGQVRARIASRYAALHGVTCVVISAGLATPLHEATRDQAIAGLAAALAPGLSSLGDTTAFCCYNDLVAQAVVRVLRERGRRIPQDAAVIGFDNLFADLIDPPLTTIDHCLDEMGRRAAMLALRMIDEPGARDRLISHREVIPARLVLRTSA